MIIGVWPRHLREFYGPLTKYVDSFGTLCKIMIGLSGNGLSQIRIRPWTWPTKMFLTNSIRLGGRVKDLIVTWSNLVVTWKVRPHMGIICRFPLGLCWSSQGGCSLVPFSPEFFNFVNKTQKEHCEGPWDSSKGLYDGQILILVFHWSWCFWV